MPFSFFVAQTDDTYLLGIRTEDISLSGNQLTGFIRDFFSRFFALESVDFSNNQLTGTIPKTWFVLPRIKRIHLEANTLDGTMPPNFGNAPKLETLSLQKNTLSGTVPKIGASRLQDLRELQLFDNQLSGSIPVSVCNLVAEAALAELSADCGGVSPQIDCPCCTVCFDGSPMNLT